MSNEYSSPYQILTKEDKFELRFYPSRIVSEVAVIGNGYSDAANIGFDHLSSYIFGNNYLKNNKTEGIQIEMTAPVEVEKIEDDNYLVRFIMPSHFTLHTIPTPNDSRIKVYKEKSFKAATLLFKGDVNEKLVEQKRAYLIPWLRKNDLQPMEKPILALYNGPFTLWFLKRNEIIYKVK